VTGYSGTPIAAKLGLKPGMTMRAVHAPKDYRAILAPLPDGARIADGSRGKADIVHHFTKKKDELAKALAAYRAALDPATPVWVSWPKKSSGVATDVTEDTIRELALPLGFVDIKVCAVTDTWSGLKLVVRRDRR
jgi:Protein of unknown function (DUF3052)